MVHASANYPSEPKRGADKTAAIRRQKKLMSQTTSGSTQYYCVCGEEYLDLTDEIQQWIGCDSCDSWFHCQCVGVADSIPESFLCSKCSST